MKEVWSRGDKIAVAGILLGVVGVVSAIIVVPEVRRAVGLDRPDVLNNTSSTPQQPSPHAEVTEPATDSSSTVARTVASPQEDAAAVEEARIASEASDFSPMTMQEYFDAWFSNSTTDLQRTALEERMLRKRVIWQGLVRSVAAHDEKIRVIVEPSKNTGRAAFLDFDRSQRDDLLALRPAQEIRFTCVIEGYVASPFLGSCRILALR